MQCPIVRINDDGEQNSTRLAIEHVALKSFSVEARLARFAKREARLAYRAYNYAKSRRVCFGLHANRTLWRKSSDTTPFGFS
jgi:hypothetical protein